MDALRCLLPHRRVLWLLELYWNAAFTAAFNGIVRQLRPAGPI